MVTISSYTPAPPPPHSSFHSYHSDVTCQGLFRMWIARSRAQHVSCRGRIEPIKKWTSSTRCHLLLTLTSLHFHMCIRTGTYLFVPLENCAHFTFLRQQQQKSCINSDKLSSGVWRLCVYREKLLPISACAVIPGLLNVMLLERDNCF